MAASTKQPNNNTHKYLILNSCYGGPSFNDAFIEEVFTTFPPQTTNLGKELFPSHTIIDNDDTMDLSRTLPFFDSYHYVLRPTFFHSIDEPGSNPPELEKSGYIICCTTKSLYYLTTHPKSWHSNNELIQWILHRKDQLILDENNKFKPYFYKMLGTNFNFRNKFELLFETIDTITDTSRYVASRGFKYIVSIEYSNVVYDFYRDDVSGKDFVFYFQDDKKEKINVGRIIFDENNWRDNSIVTDAIFKVYSSDISGEYSSNLRIVSYNKDLEYNYMEYDGIESIKTILPYRSIITELASMVISREKIECNKFTQMILDGMSYDDLKQKYEKEY